MWPLEHNSEECDQLRIKLLSVDLTARSMWIQNKAKMITENCVSHTPALPNHIINNPSIKKKSRMRKWYCYIGNKEAVLWQVRNCCVYIYTQEQETMMALDCKMKVGSIQSQDAFVNTSLYQLIINPHQLLANPAEKCTRIHGNKKYCGCANFNKF